MKRSEFLQSLAGISTLAVLPIPIVNILKQNEPLEIPKEFKHDKLLSNIEGGHLYVFDEDHSMSKHHLLFKTNFFQYEIKEDKFDITTWEDWPIPQYIPGPKEMYLFDVVMPYLTNYPKIEMKYQSASPVDFVIKLDNTSVMGKAYIMEIDRVYTTNPLLNMKISGKVIISDI